MAFNLEGVLSIGATQVLLKRPGCSSVTIANILGREVNAAGEMLWLDRVIHEGRSERFAAGWEGAGAVVTVLQGRTTQQGCEDRTCVTVWPRQRA